MAAAIRRGVDGRIVVVLAAVLIVAGMLVLARRDPALAGHLAAEYGVLEWVQVALLAAAAALAVGQARLAMADGGSPAFEVAMLWAFGSLIIGELDPDRALFGVKVISTRFFVNPRYALPLRLLAVVVVVGVPVAIGLWLLPRWRTLWRASLDGLQAAWGQMAAAGLACYPLSELVEDPLKVTLALPPHAIEEAIELAGALMIFVGLAARRRAIMSRMSPRVLCLLVALALALPGCRNETVAANQPKPQAAPPREVKVVTVTERSLARTVAATGTLAADEQVVLGTKVPGRVAEVAVDLGSRVKRGQVIARLDPGDFKLRVEQAEAALQQARARLGLPPTGADERIDPEQTAIVRQARAVLDEARLTRDRSLKLLEQELIARAQVDTAEANLKVAESRYQDALEEVRNRQAVIAQRRSELDLARQQLADTVIVAPTDGAVSLKQAAVGEYLPAGAPVATLVRVHPLRLRVAVPEREGAAVRVGQLVRLTVEGDETVYQGRVQRLSPIVHEQNRTLLVEAEVPNERGRLRPGSFARAEVLTDAGQPVVTVPASAIIVFAGVEKVLVVRDGRTAEVRVATGRRIGEDVEIVDGLKRGAVVVARPGNLTGGQPVTVAR